MKNILFKLTVFLVFMTYSFNVYSDQLSYITRLQADSAVTFLKKQQEILIWCGCCDNSSKTIIKVNKIDVVKTGYLKFYQIKVYGVNRTGIKKEYDIDLAYTYILKHGKWYSLGKILGFDCDPCTKPFVYKEE